MHRCDEARHAQMPSGSPVDGQSVSQLAILCHRQLSGQRVDDPSLFHAEEATIAIGHRLGHYVICPDDVTGRHAVGRREQPSLGRAWGNDYDVAVFGKRVANRSVVL